MDILDKMAIPHHGNTLRSLRLALNLNQDQLADKIGLSQASISLLEALPAISDDKLKPITDFFQVSLERFKEFNFKDALGTNNYHDNTFNSAEHSSEIINSANSIQDGRTININPLDKVSELYERMLKDKDDAIAALKAENDLLKSRI